jgi:hypothetical protein
VKASELAYRAAQEMSERGHCKKVSENSLGKVCFYGAINRASETTILIPQDEGVVSVTSENILTYLQYPWLMPAVTYARDTPERSMLVREIRDILHERGVTEWKTPHLYNDREDITGEDVILLLKEAGSRLEARGC